MNKLEILEDLNQALKMCKNINSNNSINSVMDWAKGSNSFSKISQCYQFTNEQLDAYYSQIDLKDKDVLTVCGSGDQVICALLNGAKKVDTFDTNKLTYYYLFLKISAIKALDYIDFLELMNLYCRNSNRKEYYKNIRDLIPKEDIKMFWDEFFKENEDLFPAFFLGGHNNKNFTHYEAVDNISLNENKSRILYLNEMEFQKAKTKLNNNNISFKNIDLLDVNTDFNNKYDFINCSNIAFYITDKNELINLFKDIIDNNLNENGAILLNYYWSLINEEYNSSFLDFKALAPEILTLKSKIKKDMIYYDYDTALIYRKKK